MRHRITLLMLATLAIFNSAKAASFDCKHAKQPDEKTICADRTLNDKDVTLALLYSIDRRFMAMGERGAMMDAQNAWLAQRHACGTASQCLHDLYDRRIKDLREFIDQRVVTKGPF